MPRTLLLALAFALLVGAPASAQTAEQSAAIAVAEEIGRDLYHHDRAAWMATDALFAEMGDSARTSLRGWVTEREGESVAVTFVSAGSDESVYRAVYQAGTLIVQGARRAPLTPTQLQLFRARSVAVAALTEPCSNAYNSVTLPRPDGLTDVYLMPGTVDPDAVLIGGFFRVRVRSDGEVVETQRFSRSCLSLARNQFESQGGQTTALYFSHVLGSVPTETHVFINLTHTLPLYVSTSAGIWQIENGRITLQRSPRQ